MQNKECSTTEWPEKWYSKCEHIRCVAHHGRSCRPLFVQYSSFCLLSMKDMQVSG